MSETESRTESSAPEGRQEENTVVHWLKGLLLKKTDNEDMLREALEDYIEELSAQSEDGETAASHERTLLSNILELRDMNVSDVMVPRADIIALDISTSPDELLKVLAEKQHSRIPVYRGSLDEIIGIIHVKDVLQVLANHKPLIVKDLVREAPVVSPSLPVMDLLLMLRENRQKLVFVVDEYGGIDGLATIGDIVAAIIGEVQDEYKGQDIPEMTEDTDLSILADARTPITDFEHMFGEILSQDQRDDIDTIGGFIFALAGRVPTRGELIRHEETGIVFEILDASPRRVTRVRIRRPHQPDAPLAGQVTG